MATLPVRDESNVMSREEVVAAVKSLKRHKAVGADGIPVEIYKASPQAFQLLFELLVQQIWDQEVIPAASLLSESRLPVLEVMLCFFH